MWFLTRGRIYHWTWTDCKLSMFLFNTTRYYSSWLLVIMSIEKFFILYFPLKAKSICTVRMAKRVCFIAACVFIVYGMQWFFIEKASKNKNGFPICIYINVPRSYTKTYFYTDAALYSFGPFTLMIISNCAIIYKLLMAKWLAKRGGTESTNQALSKAAVKGTAMLITVSITFMILTGPTAVSLMGRIHPIQRVVMNLLQYLNHSINGVLYCIVGTRFRNELFKALGCRRNISGRSESGVSFPSSSRKQTNETIVMTNLDDTSSHM